MSTQPCSVFSDKLCCYVRIPEAFNSKLQVLLGTRQGSRVLEHAFQPDLGTHLILRRVLLGTTAK